MKKITISILLLVNLILSAQSSKKELLGYWQNQDETTIYYAFIKKYAIDISIYPDGEIVESLYTYGFSDESELKSINDLKDSGLFYYEIDPYSFDEDFKEKDGTYSLIQANVIQMEDDKNSFQIYDPARPGQRGTYKRIKHLPKEIINYYLKKSKKDNRDYFKEFFNSEFKTIKSSKATIYSAPNQPTKMYLVKGDEVECLEEKEGWYKIRYYGKKTIEGWVKKEDILE